MLVSKSPRHTNADPFPHVALPYLSLKRALALCKAVPEAPCVI
jgi:hypothetical protein